MKPNSNNKEEVLSITEEYAHQYNSNNLTENKVSEEVNSSAAEEKKEQEHNQIIKEASLKENDRTSLTQKFQPRMGTDKMDMAIDESTLVKFRNNFFEVTTSLSALFVGCSVISTSPQVGHSICCILWDHMLA